MGAQVKKKEKFDYNIEEKLAPIYGLKMFLMEEKDLLSPEQYELSCKAYNSMFELQNKFRTYLEKRKEFFESGGYNSLYSESIEDSLKEGSKSKKAAIQVHAIDDICSSMYNSWKEVRDQAVILLNGNVMREICDKQNERDSSLTVGIARRYGISFYSANWILSTTIIHEVIKNRILPNKNYINVEKDVINFDELLSDSVDPFIGIPKARANKADNNFYV